MSVDAAGSNPVPHLRDPLSTPSLGAPSPSPYSPPRAPQTLLYAAPYVQQQYHPSLPHQPLPHQPLPHQPPIYQHHLAPPGFPYPPTHLAPSHDLPHDDASSSPSSSVHRPRADAPPHASHLSPSFGLDLSRVGTAAPPYVFPPPHEFAGVSCSPGSPLGPRAPGMTASRFHMYRATSAPLLSSQPPPPPPYVSDAASSPRRYCKTCKRWQTMENYVNEGAKTCRRCILIKKQKRSERKMSAESLRA